VICIVYDQNGIVVRSIPAIHAGDGPVSFIIEYAGMKLVFSGDTVPNKYFVEYARNADFVIHEAFSSAEYFVNYGMPAQLAWRACCEFHTSGPAFGKIMSTINPRHAVAYHSFADSFPELREGIRDTYDGPLSVADDMMVWNVTDEQVVIREAIVTEDVAPTGTTHAYRMAKREPPEVAKDWISPDINAGKWEGYTPPPLPKQ
jgi:ribonuclease Z